MEHSCVIGVDYGTDSVRAVLADAFTGEMLASSVCNYPRWARGLYCDPARSQFRQHPSDYVESLEAVLTDLVRQSPDAVRRVRALSVDATSSTPCLVTADCTPLSLLPRYAENPDAMFVLWKDHTANRESEEITALCARSEPNYARHSGNHYSSECFWAKALHLLRSNDGLRSDAFALLELCDWIPALLTGGRDMQALKLGHCAAGSKQMWAEEWGGYPPQEFFAALDPDLARIARNMNPANHTCDTVAGTLTPEWAARFGLPEGVLVGVGNIDAHSGAVGAGVGYKTVVLNLGTSACYMAVMPAEHMGERLIEGIFGQVDDSIVPGMVGFEAGLSAFGDVYAWFKRLLCYPLRDVLSQTELVDAPTRDRLVEETGDKLMDALTEAAAALPQRVDAPQATDWLNGRRNPYPDPSLTGSLLGLTLSTSAPELYYAFAEATAFATKAIIDHLEKNGVEIDRLVGIGGISQKSPFVMQMLADVMNREVVVAGCPQACAMGAVVYASVIAGCHASVPEAQEALCRFPSTTFFPDAERHTIFLRRYARYRQIGAFTAENTLT